MSATYVSADIIGSSSLDNLSRMSIFICIYGSADMVDNTSIANNTTPTWNTLFRGHSFIFTSKRHKLWGESTSALGTSHRRVCLTVT